MTFAYWEFLISALISLVVICLLRYLILPYSGVEECIFPEIQNLFQIVQFLGIWLFALSSYTPLYFFGASGYFSSIISDSIYFSPLSFFLDESV